MSLARNHAGYRPDKGVQMFRFPTSRALRVTVAAATCFAAASVALPNLAGASGKPDATRFSMTPNASFVPCLSADGKTAPTVDVRVERGDQNDRMDIRGRGFKPGIQFDLFTIQNSRLNSAGAPDAGFKGFGMSWYQTDLHADEHGRIDVRIRTILLDQIFGLIDKGPTPAPPTNTFHVGFWFNSPADAAACGFTGVTPFNGEHNAGPLAFVTLPDQKTELGPLCVSPTTTNGKVTCNP
jgi:hypothetical protein